MKKKPEGGPPPADTSLDRLRGAGWSIAEYTVRFVRPAGLVSIVVGESGEDRLLSEGLTRDEAALRACKRAETLGWLLPDEG